MLGFGQASDWVKVVDCSRDLRIAICPLISFRCRMLPSSKNIAMSSRSVPRNRLPIPSMDSRNNNRYGSQLHQRDARPQLFDNSGYGYPGDGRASPRVASAYRPAAPNSRGQYSASVLEELESQNDAQVEGLSAKVKMLKDVCCGPLYDLQVLTGVIRLQRLSAKKCARPLHSSRL